MQQQAAQDENERQAGRNVHTDALNDGIGLRRIRPPANEAITRGSPWALAPWPILEIRKWLADRMDRWLPGRGNRALLKRAGDDPQARLTATTHGCIAPALRRVRERLEAEGYSVALDHEAMRIVLRAHRFNGTEVTYAVEGGLYQAPVFSLADLHTSPEGESRARVRIISRGAAREFRLEHCGEAAIYRDALLDLRNQMLC